MRLLYFFFPFLFLAESLLAQSHIVVEGYWKNSDRKRLELEFFEDTVIGKSTWLSSKIDSLTGYFSFGIHSDLATKLQLLNQFIFALPNDTIQVSIEKDENGMPKLRFTSAKEKEESFYLQLQKSIKPVVGRDFSFEKAFAIEDYKKEAVDHYNMMINFLDNHSSGYSSYARTMIMELVTVDYYSNLIYPLSSRKISKEQLPPDYFGDIDISLFNRRDLMGFREYVLLLNNFNSCYYGTLAPKDKMHDSLTVIKRITSAKTHFAGEARANLLLLQFESLVRNGTRRNANQIDELFNDVSTLFKENPERLKQINELKRRFDLLGRPLPEQILSQQLRSEKGEMIFLSNVLHQQKLIYVDLWASWCGPCIAEIPLEKELISELNKNIEVEFIFISLDETEERWKKAMKKINIGKSHYRLPDGFSSKLTTYLNIKTIPRYLVIDKNGSLISYDAPRPSDILKDKSKLFSLIR